MSQETNSNASAATIAQIQNLAVRFGSSKKVVAVNSLRDASKAWEKLRDERGLGASQSLKVTVVDLNAGKAVASISYNGRAWGVDGKEIDLGAGIDPEGFVNDWASYHRD